MAYSRRPSRTPRSRFTLALLLLTAVTLLVLDLPGTGPLDPVRNAFGAAFRPFRAAGSAVFEPLSNGWKGAFGYGDLEDENQRLKAEAEERKSEQADLARLRQKVADQNKILGVEVDPIKTKVAEVVSGPLNSFEQTVEIDAGSSSGVKKGMAVITGRAKGAEGGAVFGKVVEVRSNSSTVELITESDVMIGVRTQKGEVGTATGQGQDEPLLIEGIDELTLAAGDFLWTSGIDRSAFPGDLYIGRITEVGKSVDGVPRVVEAEPAADLTSRYVRVVLKDPPG
ncbi:rod shape-determining protein MreC [Aquihabitans daechungensis]|uniref:rod shape-determining protein MreC n=1 Tax=Aquihabitans daechungensis TaxID=1052257 RepID=UPI003BA2CC66